MANKTMPAPGDVVAGKYEIVEMIGEGGMGAVFAATHQLTGKRIALKWLLPELASKEGAVQRFIREAQAAGRIDHPNVVDVYDVCEHEESMFLVMEFLRGESLSDALERGGLTVQEVLAMVLPAMRGVCAAHRKGVVHRDLKPDNIFLCRDEQGNLREPKVLDFGISKISSSDGQVNPRLTKTGAVMGTPYYMSPEQIRGSHEVDRRADVYAFGVILYEALTGEVPFHAETYSALILEIATGTPRRPQDINPNLPDALQDVVMKAMARELEDRFADIETLAHALEPFTDARFEIERRDPTGRTASPQTAGQVTTTPFAGEVGPSDIPVEVPIHRGRGVLLASIAALVAAAAVGLYLGLGDDSPEPDYAPATGVAASQGTPAVAPATEQAQPLEAIAGKGGQLPEGKAAPPAAAEPTAEKVPAAAPQAPSEVRAEPAPKPKKSSAAERRERRRRSAKAKARRTPTPAASPAPAKAAPKKPPARVRGRTGGLSVDDF